MRARLARPEEFAYLESRLKESGFSLCDLYATPCVVTEAGGALTGMLPIRLLTDPVAIWQMEPLLVWCESQMGRRRAMYLLGKAAEDWIRSEHNQTGVRRYLAVTFQDEVKGLLAHGGLTQLGEPETTAFAHLSVDRGAAFFFRQL